MPLAQAATINVDVGCTLIQAIKSANTAKLEGGCELGTDGLDTIILPNNQVFTYDQGYPNTAFDRNSATPNITSNITIEGNGSTIERSTAIGTPLFRMFRKNGASHLTLNDMTLRNGYLKDTGRGGAIYAQGQLTLNNVTITNNTSTNVTLGLGGGGIFVDKDSEVTINNSNISNNTTEQNGGGIFVNEDSTVSIYNSTFSGNSAGYDGGGIYAVSGGGIYAVPTEVTIDNSTISNNSASRGGGILSRAKGGIDSPTPNVAISNSTISGNTCEISGGGVHAYRVNLTLNNSTVSSNFASEGTGGSGIHGEGFGTLTFNNTILANSINGSSDCTKNFDGLSVVSNGKNIIENNDCGIQTLSVDPKLGPLKNNGGPTKTHALLPGSPAIDAGDNALCAGSYINNLDQRNETRPFGKACDLGAFEYGDRSRFFVVPLSTGKSVIFGL